jgi:exonuclease III
MLSWNCGTLNIALPGLQALINKENPPSIIAIQETKLTASKQGGYLPRKLQKLWKKELATYHIIRKTIKLTTQNTNWGSHPLITNLQNHPHTTIHNPPNNPT